MSDLLRFSIFFFFFNDTATTEIYTLSLHDALPISFLSTTYRAAIYTGYWNYFCCSASEEYFISHIQFSSCNLDRKSTRLNSSHANISYAVFCLKKKNNITATPMYRIEAYTFNLNYS